MRLHFLSGQYIPRHLVAPTDWIWLLRLVVALYASACCSGSTADDVLRIGHVMTQDEARIRLSEMANAVPNASAWRQRADAIRQGILKGTRLERLPSRCPLNPIRHSRREFDGYSVENVAFEALHGFFVTGNLYLPSSFTKPLPGVLSPHGHKKNKRRLSSTQYRCATLARMGAAVFTWDMLGYGESEPCTHKHGEAMRLQTFSSLRAVDFMISLGIVDEDRLAVTGASGGGTQSFILAAIDPRIDVSAPVVQVSAHFYGGCVCESGMPIHVQGDFETNNVEIAALIAPKPLLLVSDGGDWTANTPNVEFPYVQRIYRLLNAQENVENAHFADEGHDNGPSKRKAVYQFFAAHLRLNLSSVQDGSGEIGESFVKLLEPAELAVFNEDHPRPAHAVVRCADIVASLDQD